MTSSLAFETCFSLVVQVSLVIVATVAIERWLGDARTNCRLWTISFLSIVGLVVAAFLLPHLRWVSYSPSLRGQTVLSILSWQSRILWTFAVIWSVGVGVAVLRRGVRCFKLMQFLNRDCRSMTADEIAALPLQDCVIPENTRWLVSDDLQGPFCWQFHRPTIVLPLFAIAEEDKTLRRLLIHELEHLRTNHPMQYFLQGVCGILLWFHPLAWWAARRAELAREYLCDEVAATSVGPVAEYLRTLAKVAERSARPPTCTLAFGRCHSALVRRGQRLYQVASNPRPRSGLRNSVGISMLLLAVLATTQVWLPVNVLASSKSRVSPWPGWTAHVLHDFGISIRDFERFDERLQLHELSEHNE